MDTVIITAAGASRRMGRKTPKVFLKVNGKPVLAHALEPVRRVRPNARVIVAVRQQDIAACRRLLDHAGRPDAQIVSGGASRAQSVWNALKQIDNPSGLIAVHDGARPNADAALWKRVFDAAQKHGAAVPVLPVSDTIKSERAGFIGHTLDRTGLVLVQTPQVFDAALLMRAYSEAGRHRRSATDDAALVERLGHPVSAVPGDLLNFKITYPGHLKLMAGLLK